MLYAGNRAAIHRTVFRSFQESRLFLHQRADLQRQAEQVDEAGAVRLIVDVVLFKGHEFLIVQRILGLRTRRDDVTAIELQAHYARDRALRRIHERVESLA